MNLTLKSFAVVFVSGKESYTFLLFICIPEEKKKKKKKKKKKIRQKNLYHGNLLVRYTH